MNTTDALTAVIYKRDGWWVAQVLEYDIAAQAITLDDLEYELLRLLAGRSVIGKELGIDAFEGLTAAPEIFWKMAANARRVESPKRVPVRVPGGPVISAPALCVA